jgi:hypothetical protein
VTQEFISGVGTPQATTERRQPDLGLINLTHRVDKIADKVASLESNHIEHKQELKELSAAVSKLSNTISRGIWILIGGASVLAFLVSGQFTQTVKTGAAIVGVQ